jgi:hypothetical protein
MYVSNFYMLEFAEMNGHEAQSTRNPATGL